MLILAEALSTEPVLDQDGRQLYRARVLPKDSEKFMSMQTILQCRTVSYFLELHQMLDRALGCGDPLVIVTDWTDPCEVVGLRLENGREIQAFPNLCFLALETNWKDLRRSGIEEIFAHELSHLWLHRMGYQPALSQSNRFHTSTAITAHRPSPWAAALPPSSSQLTISRCSAKPSKKARKGSVMAVLV